MAKADVSARLRRAIILNDITLVQRILEYSPACLHNPDFNDKSNTSLHLAAQYGLAEIAEYLISLGHDGVKPVEDYIYSNMGNNMGISLNTDGRSPLHLASAYSHAPVVELLCQQFPDTIKRKDNEGCTPLHLALCAPGMPPLNPFSKTTTKTDDISTIEILLANDADPNAQDKHGDTCLHNASAWGNLKGIRALVENGADPLRKNFAGWAPEDYSVTVQAEVYYKNLVSEWEKRKAGEAAKLREKRATGGAGLRIVSDDDDDDEDVESSQSQGRPDSRTSHATSAGDSGLGIRVGNVDSWR